MPKFGLKTVFSKLFTSVMLTLVLFTIAMITLTHLVHDNSVTTRWEILAKQIVNQIDPFVDDFDDAMSRDERLQARFMLAVIKKSFDIFDESLQAKMGLYDNQGHLLIQTDDSDLPKELPADPSWILQILPSFSTTEYSNVRAISDRGYVLLYEPRNPPKRSEVWAILNLFTGTLALLIIMTIVLWWIARSMTWRINKMSWQMTRLGEGDFSVRVPAKGNDEIANLARGFNQSAQKIEQLINANSLLLAHASHELRTPITRIRLQVEMMEMLASGLPDDIKDKFHKRAQAVNRDLTGLNDLVESILLVSRLDAGHATQQDERFDLYELISQECQHYPEATFFGKHIVIEGQSKLLIHLIRNLLNNALIHGKPPIEVHLYGVIHQEDAYTPPQKFVDFIAQSKLELNTDKNDTNHHAVIDSATNLDKTQNHTTTNDSHHLIKQNANSLSLNQEANKQVQPEQNSDTGVNKTSQDEGKVAKHTQSLSTQVDALKDKPALKKSDSNKSSENRFTKRLRRTKTQVEVPPNYAVLTVIDQGKGIPLDKRQEIFSPFVRLQQQKKGSGLGLSLVAQIVEAHHGVIKTDTYHGHTRFIVILPTTAESSIKPKIL